LQTRDRGLFTRQPPEGLLIIGFLAGKGIFPVVDHYQDQKARQKVSRVLGERMKGREEEFAFRKGGDDYCSRIILSLDSGKSPRCLKGTGIQISFNMGINHTKKSDSDADERRF